MSDGSRRGWTAPKISWAAGSAYDLFASLYVIHNAESTGLRKAWAAGVRNRLSARNRETLGLLAPVVAVPVEWISTLGQFPEAGAALSALVRLEDAEVLGNLVDSDLLRHPTVAGVLRTGTVSANDVRSVADDPAFSAYSSAGHRLVGSLLALFADPAESGRLVKAAIAEYHERFFQEEEARIAEHLSRALANAMELAARSSTIDLVEELTGGLRLEEAERAEELRFIPSFWAGPLTLFEMIGGMWVILFSARPRNVSLIPGDPVPDSLLRSLQAVSDPTRLRILKLLAAAKRTQAGISRELRLRPPTITHHLRILRLANLVGLTETVNGEKLYDVRVQRLKQVQADLDSFLGLDAAPPT